MSLDKKGKGHVVEILKESAKDLGSLFVISHDDDIKDKFDNVFNIKKIGGVSCAT